MLPPKFIPIVNELIVMDSSVIENRFGDFQPTHVVMTQADKARTNGVRHCYKFGTEVMWVKSVAGMVKTVSLDGTVQFVELNDLRVTTV